MILRFKGLAIRIQRAIAVEHGGGMMEINMPIMDFRSCYSPGVAPAVRQYAVNPLLVNGMPDIAPYPCFQVIFTLPDRFDHIWSGVYDTEAIAHAMIANPLREHITPSQVYRVVPAVWPDSWKDVGRASVVQSVALAPDQATTNQS